MVKRTLLLAAALVTVGFQPMAAPARADLDTPRTAAAGRAGERPAPPDLPPAGETFQDPEFGTTILRVTDESDGRHNKVAYSYWPTFNLDDTRVLAQTWNGQGFVYDFDPDAMTIANKRPLFAKAPPVGGTPFVEDAIWSALDPDVIYGHFGPRLWAYDVVTQRYRLLHNFAPQVPSLWQMSRSLDDNVFCFTWATPTGSAFRGWVCWRRDTNRVWRHRQPLIDEVKIDKSGRYAHVALTRSGAGKVEGQVVDLTTMRITGLRDNYPDFNPGHADMGEDLIVGVENWQNRLLGRHLSTPHQRWVVWDFGDDWSEDSHVSLLKDGDRWAIVSTYVPDGVPAPGEHHNEIFAVTTDGSRQLVPLAHHYSVVREYSESPFANISRDGRFVAFTSNWGGQDRTDVFVLKVPDGALD